MKLCSNMCCVKCLFEAVQLLSAFNVKEICNFRDCQICSYNVTSEFTIILLFFTYKWNFGKSKYLDGLSLSLILSKNFYTNHEWLMNGTQPNHMDLYVTPLLSCRTSTLAASSFYIIFVKSIQLSLNIK